MSTLLCARAASAQLPAAGRGESPRSAERNSPLNLSEKLPAQKGRTRLRSSRTPLSRCKKRVAPSGTNTPAAVRVPRSAGAEKGCRPVRDESPPLWFSAAKQKHRRPPVRGVSHYSISSRTEKAASCSVLSSLYSISREYALQMQICAQCVTSPLASHSYTSSS